MFDRRRCRHPVLTPHRPRGSVLGDCVMELCGERQTSGNVVSLGPGAREEMHERLSRRLITGDQVMLAHVYLKQGCVVPKHSHENEQFTYILEGALRFLVGDAGAEEIVVRAGEVLHLPAHVPHEAHALEDTLDMDIFYPPRADWLNKTDSYLRKK